MTAIPELFIINEAGEIATIGHPGAMDVAEAVAKTLGELLPEAEAEETDDKQAEANGDRVPIAQ